jgi:hypothetical protein
MESWDQIAEDRELFIIVDEGDTFEGTFDAWKDCFFTNPTIQRIKDFCEKELGGATVRFEWRQGNQQDDRNPEVPH